MATYATLTVDPDALLENREPGSDVVVKITTNTGGVIFDTATGKAILANWSEKIAGGAATTFSLPTTNGATNPTDFQYMIVLNYIDTVTRKRHDHWSSGWVSFTADATLAGLVAEQYVPPTWMTDATATLQTYVDAGQAAATTAAAASTTASGAADTAVNAAGLASEIALGDGGAALAAADLDPGSAFRLQNDPRMATVIAARTYPRGEDQNTLGIPTDGTSDCLAALNAIPANTGRVHLRGVFKTSGKVTLKNRVQLVGVDARSSEVRAGPGFVGTAVIQLGDGTVAFGTRLQDLTVNADSLAAAAVIGVNLQESSGLERALVTGWSTLGVDLTDGQNQNYSVREVELYGTNAVNGIGMRTGPGPARRIEDVTAIPAGAVLVAPAAGSIGLLLESPGSHVSGLHFEGAAVGLDLNGATGSSISGVTGIGGTGAVGTLVKVRNMAQDNIHLAGLFPNGSTLTIDDLLHSYSYAGSMAVYAWSGGGAGVDNVLNIGDPAATPIS